jgi:tetratricopeptide (TPR) repeat protein
MAVVQFQLGTLLGRMDRFDEARAAFRAAADVEPDNPHVPIAVAGLLLRARQSEDAHEQAALAVALAEHADSYARAAANRMAARVALVSEDFDRAMIHAEASERDDPSVPMRPFVRGCQLFHEGRYDEALTSFQEAAALLTHEGRAVEDLHLYLGHTFARLERTADAEEQYRTELRIYPRNTAAYSSLVTLYQAAHRVSEAGDVANLLVESLPTPQGYQAASGLWVALGDKARAAAIRADGLSRFRPGPSLARLGPDGQQ